MKLKDLKRGMVGYLKNNETITVIDDTHYLRNSLRNSIGTLYLHYNENLTHRTNSDLDIIKITYGDEIVYERQGKTPIDWLPEMDETYYFIKDDEIRTFEWDYDIVDIRHYYSQRLFKTYEEAEKHLEWLQTKRSIELEIARLNDGWEPDWEDEYEIKYYIMYYEELKCYSRYGMRTTENSLYLKSQDLAERLIETHKKELLIYFEVSENEIR